MNRLILKFLKFSIQKIAKSHGFLDPLDLVSKLSRFGQPSEVSVPTELLRAGAVMHARGLINSQSIQYNMDWVWPYWVSRQFDPLDFSFVPRAFSLSHINLTHRNWTAVGLPGLETIPIVDPRGLLTPFWDGWSVDCAIIQSDGKNLFPSQLKTAEQRLELNEGPEVVTIFDEPTKRLKSKIDVKSIEGRPVCRFQVEGETRNPAWMAISLRPYNPEGISFIETIKNQSDPSFWRINQDHDLRLSTEPDLPVLSNYSRGDVYSMLPSYEEPHRIECDVGLASGMFLYRLKPGVERFAELQIPLTQESDRLNLISQSSKKSNGISDWSSELKGSCEIRIPDSKIQNLYEISQRTLILLSPGDVYPGPFTYRRFWYRDSAFILHALLCSNLINRVRECLGKLFERQESNGYFLSQKGEWDSNGEVLWIFDRFFQLSNLSLEKSWIDSLGEGAEWIRNKRLKDTGDNLHAGLLPAGFSAEHFGPNDYYYWDDFWSVAGLQSVANIFEKSGRVNKAREFQREAVDLFDCIFSSITESIQQNEVNGIPASPYRSMDAGAIGSLVCSYPLQLVSPEDNLILDTVDFLRENCFVKGAFFQEMIHSGMNPYLSLHVAQVYLRAGEREKYWQIVDTIANLSSPTGQWPEAIHPSTGGGCMGDGQHGWAAADWNMAIRNSFVREEQNEKLVLFSGIPEEWLQCEDEIKFGPTRTQFGEITVTIEQLKKEIKVTWEAHWFEQQPAIEVNLPGYATRFIDEKCNSVRFSRSEKS